MPRKKQTATTLPKSPVEVVKKKELTKKPFADVPEPVSTPEPEPKSVPEPEVPEVETEPNNEVQVEVEEETPWERVKCLSDSKIMVEAVNIAPFGKKAVLLRFTIDGSLTGQIISLHDIQYREGSDKFK